MSHEKFSEFVTEKWNKDIHLLPQLQQLSYDLQDWNKNVFYNIFQEKRTLIACIGGIYKQPWQWNETLA